MHSMHTLVSVHTLSCVYGMCQKNVITCQIFWKAFAQLQLSALCAVYPASLATPSPHQTVFQRAFVCGAVSRISAMDFLPSTSKLATFS